MKINIHSAMAMFNAYRDERVGIIQSSLAADAEQRLLREAHERFRRNLEFRGIASVFDWTNHGSDAEAGK